MTQKELEKLVYIPDYNTGLIEAMTYESYLDDYGSDLCTSPKGVCNRLHIREVEGGNEGTEYQVWSWGPNGSNPSFSGYSFDNPVDAKLHIYKHKEWYLQDFNWNAPRCYDAYREAEKAYNGEEE